MHHHLEIIMPPTEDIPAAVNSIMKKFNEDPDTSEMSEKEKSEALYDTRYSFYDWYVIGGRWAGHKAMSKYDPKKLDEFYQWLNDEKVTVSGVRAGKEKLEPESQISKVDEKWNEMFPSDKFVACPVFSHSNDQYGTKGKSTIDGDICLLKDISPTLEAERVIVGGPSYNKGTWDGPLEAAFMVCTEEWNGVNYVDTKWDGNVLSALKLYEDKMRHKRGDINHLFTPQADWLVVTVDYHS